MCLSGVVVSASRCSLAETITRRHDGCVNSLVLQPQARKQGRHIPNVGRRELTHNAPLTHRDMSSVHYLRNSDQSLGGRSAPNHRTSSHRHFASQNGLIYLQTFNSFELYYIEKAILDHRWLYNNAKRLG